MIVLVSQRFTIGKNTYLNEEMKAFFTLFSLIHFFLLSLILKYTR